LPRRSKAFGSVTLARQLGRWRFGGEVVGSDERFDSIDEDPTTRLAPYAILNLVATYAPAPNWTVEARWDNVFDTDYALARGYNTPGSNIFVAIRYRLK
jgi:vitamin B12 transporter